MKTKSLLGGSLCFLVCPFTVLGIVITHDTVIGPNDTTYDNQPVIISNSVVTADGPHTFESLRVAAGATLTHSASANGLVNIVSSVSDEPQTLINTNPATLANSNVVLSSVVVRNFSGSIKYSNATDYVLATSNSLATVARTDSSTIPDGATVLVSYDYAVATTNAGLNLTLVGGLEVEPGAVVAADGRGYGGNAGPGNGFESGSPQSGGGAGYGGGGGLSSSNAIGGAVYGSLYTPMDLGSGGGAGWGGAGGAGGGSIRINAGGNAILNGVITANGLNGTNSRSGGGSGGSIWLAAQTISGSGSVLANGGAGEPIHGGGGGGGRITFEFQNNTFAGRISAYGGAGWQAGGAGTIFMKPFSAAGQITLDNGGALGALTALTVSNSPALIVQGKAVAASTGVGSFGSLIVRSNSAFGPWPIDNVGVTLIISGDATIEPTAFIKLDGLGNPQNSGPGIGQPATGAGTGAGHGGYGGGVSGALGGNYYDTITSPTQPGSGGHSPSAFPTYTGGTGGGVLRLTVNGNLRLDGRLSADGTVGAGTLGGGGAGGSIWLTLGGLSGSGVISANGGSGGLPSGGGGGGGRIAITWTSNSFTGALTARGGPGWQAGGAGTIYTKANTAIYADFRVENGGVLGTNTVLDITAGSMNVLVTNGGSLRTTASSLSFGTLTVASSSVLWLGSTFSVAMTINSNLTVASGGSIAGDGLGWPSGQGTSGGNGLNSPLGSGGGGHGGYGGRGAGATGGAAYDPTANPVQAGSGGGSSFLAGGAGGSAFRLNVLGSTVVNGTISANGQTSPTNNSGGGAGGTLYLSLNQFSGNGVISADGGAANVPNAAGGGGGGGGRIALYYNSNSFTGSFSAKGGNGFVPGGAGTIYIKANNANNGNLTVDNGGLAGTNTVFDTISLQNLTVGPGAILRSSLSGLTLTSLTVQSNGTFLAAGSTLTVTSNATVALGGKISGDGQSNTGTGQGSGTGSFAGSGGGGHAGYGGSGAGINPTGRGGDASDSAASPTQGGGSGGFFSTPPTPAGLGGGALRLTVNGLLNLLGSISANGLSVNSNSAGGGAGGSVWLTIGGLAGNGTISADGGSGHLPNGGGGGGGRVAIYYGSNSFTGSLTAKGGPGFAFGGAGTVYLKANTNSTASVTVDNAGVKGTNTLVNAISPFDLTLQSGAISASVAGAFFGAPSNPRDVLIRSNAIVKQTGPLIVARNVTIEAGGAINLDGIGTGGTGSGFQSGSPRGGGGHGGYGAFNPPSFGNAYDSALAPISSGSAGGNGSGSGNAPLGGLGGGATHLIVSNILLISGTISANGLNGDLNSGGGSGGSVWLTVGTLSGNGSISAKGGNGNGSAGGGGGGRIAITYASNLFTGPISVNGGTGAGSGGAGTLYLKNNASPSGSLIVDNSGLSGPTNTPLSQAFGLASNITVTGGAVAEFQGAIPTLSNLFISASGTVTSRTTDTNLYLGILDSLVIDPSSSLSLDAKGYSMGGGPGAGTSLSSKGSGGGYGGAGGNSASGAVGGVTYGSSSQPVDRGSGGGLGSGTPAGSQGGGALRISVAGNLVVNGRLSASGATGIQDDSGGGSGGSLWIMANKLTGGGSINADGGGGEMFGGGGGGGGRIAIISPMNTFTGAVSAAGGPGAFLGSDGSIFTSSALLPFSVLSHAPTGTVSNTVSQITLTFSAPVNAGSANSSNLKVFNPSGQLAGTDLSFSSAAADTLLVTFPTQNLAGDYRVEAGPGIQDLLGQATSQVYTGLFTVILPTISGIVTNTNFQPVAGVLLQPSGGLLPVTTDATGAYNLGVPPGWDGTVTPSISGSMFIPGSRSYTNITANISNENYLNVPTIAASIQLSTSNTNLLLTWPGYAGLTYTVYYSTDLVVWNLLTSPIPGTNGLMQFTIPTDPQPQKFFRITSQN